MADVKRAKRCRNALNSSIKMFSLGAILTNVSWNKVSENSEMKSFSLEQPTIVTLSAYSRAVMWIRGLFKPGRLVGGGSWDYTLLRPYYTHSVAYRNSVQFGKVILHDWFVQLLGAGWVDALRLSFWKVYACSAFCIVELISVWCRTYYGVNGNPSHACHPKCISIGPLLCKHFLDVLLGTP